MGLNLKIIRSYLLIYIASWVAVSLKNSVILTVFLAVFNMLPATSRWRPRFIKPSSNSNCWSFCALRALWHASDIRLTIFTSNDLRKSWA